MELRCFFTTGNSSRQLFSRFAGVALVVLVSSFVCHYLFTDRTVSVPVSVPKPETKPLPKRQHSPFPSVISPSSPSGDAAGCRFLKDLKTLKLDDFQHNNTEELKLQSVVSFNNVLAPMVQAIVQMDYFKFVKLNLKRNCVLWPDDSKCSLRDCSVKLCDQRQLPQAILLEDKSKQSASGDDECPSDSPKKLSAIDKTVSSENIEALDTLFECAEHDHDDGQYIDLLLNPERYTGYRGESANRIWTSIYQENCFLKRQKKTPFSLDQMCYEERIFYRSISGLHSSINIHLCAGFHVMDGTFTHNINEFIKRFSGKQEFIKNLFFLYLIELRALNKAEPYLLSKVNWQSSGDQSLTKEAIKNLLKIARNFKWHFNESILFKSQPPTVAKEFSDHFRNITGDIMDCVACEKCRLWGKVQTHGLGTAFKILLAKDIERINLNRHEIICLVNGIARLSNSIIQLDTFAKMLNGNKF